MRKFIVSCLVSFLLMIVFVTAEDITINLEPENVWIGNDLTISCWYSSNTPSAIWAYVERTSWNRTLTRFNDTFYQTTYKPPLLGTYKVYCSNGNVNSSKETFNVNSLSVSITKYNSTVYLGNNIILRAKIIERSDYEQVVLNDVDFQVYLNDKSISINSDGTYPFGEEWVITTEKLPLTGLNPSSYSLILKATYRGKTVSDSKNVYVQTPLEFDLVSMDKTWIKPNENITFTFRAAYNGNSFDFKKEYLTIWIDSDKVDVLSISQVGEYSDVVISAPDLPPGTYDLDIRFSYIGYIKDISRTIDYVVPISGSIIGSNNEVIHTQLKFSSNETERTYITDASGSYSGQLPPGTYNIEITFPKSKLILSGVILNEFDDPIKFDNPSTDVEITGIGVSSVFVFEIALTYSNAYLEMKYDDSKITDESKINLYKCENWNFGRKVCNSNWATLAADIDTVRNEIKINNTELSAFLIGYKKNLKLDFHLDKSEYYLNDLIKITGTLEDEENNPVSEAQIKVNIPGTSITASTTCDNNGVFTIEFFGPANEGKYSIILSAEKLPFANVNASEEIDVVKSEKLTILLSDSIKIKQGESVNIPLDIVNNGQTDFYNLNFSVEGVPKEYYTLPLTEVTEFKSGDEVKTSINFVIPKNASVTSYTSNFRVTYDGGSSGSQFILSILMDENNETKSKGSSWFNFPSFSLPTGMFTLPEINTYYLLIIIVAILSFSTSIFLKMKKSGGKKLEKKLERESVKNLLLDIKREIETRPPKKKND